LRLVMLREQYADRAAPPLVIPAKGKARVSGLA